MSYKYLTQLEAEYGLTQTLNFDHIHNGPDNDVFIITDSKGSKFVLRQSKRIGKKAEFEVGVLSKLAEAKFSSPQIIQTKTKADLVLIDNIQLVLFSHIQGYQIQDLSEDNLKTDIYERGARKLGELHTLTENMKIEAEPARNLFTEFDRFLSLSPENLSHFKDSEILLEQVKNFRSKAQLRIDSKKEPYGVIHNDYRVQNLIYNENDCYIIDFDWACYAPLLKDLGLAIVEWSLFDFKIGPSKPAIEKFIKGYNETAPQTVTYGEDLIFWICFACLSDTCTFIADVCEDDYKYRGEISINDVDQCRMYKKFKYFLKELNNR